MNKNKSRHGETDYLIKKMNEAIEAKLKSKNLMVESEVLQEEDFKYPNMDADVKEDNEAVKQALSNYLLKISDTDSHKFTSNNGDKNVIFYCSANIKDIPFTFSYSLDDEACIFYLPKNQNSFPLYNELINFMDDIKQYYIVWKKKWTEKLNDMEK